MPAARYDITRDQGSAERLVFRFKNPNGSVMDLSGYGARLTVKDTWGGTLLLNATDVNGLLLIEAAEGRVILAPAAEDTLGLLVPPKSQGIPPTAQWVHETVLIQPSAGPLAELVGLFLFRKKV